MSILGAYKLCTLVRGVYMQNPIQGNLSWEEDRPVSGPLLWMGGFRV